MFSCTENRLWFQLIVPLTCVKSDDGKRTNYVSRPNIKLLKAAFPIFQYASLTSLSRRPHQISTSASYTIAVKRPPSKVSDLVKPQTTISGAPPIFSKPQIREAGRKFLPNDRAPSEPTPHPLSYTSSPRCSKPRNNLRVESAYFARSEAACHDVRRGLAVPFGGAFFLGRSLPLEEAYTDEASRC